MLALPTRCDQLRELSPLNTDSPHSTNSKIYSNISQPLPETNRWSSLSPSIGPESEEGANICTFSSDEPDFSYYSSPLSNQPYMNSPMHSTPNYHPDKMDNNQDSPRTEGKAHHRESSLSSLCSAGPASPYTTNISNPQIVGEVYDYSDPSFFPGIKPMTPAQTPSQEPFLVPHFSSGFPKSSAICHEAVPLPEIVYTGRSSMAPILDNDTQVSISALDIERQRQTGETPSDSLWLPDGILCDQSYRNMVRFNQNMSSIYEDSLYDPNNLTNAQSPMTPSSSVTRSSTERLFEQRLQAAKNQHLHANSNSSILFQPQDCVSFQHGLNLAPVNSFEIDSPSLRVNTMTPLQGQQKNENDVRVFQEQICRSSSIQPGSAISPRDVGVSYHENKNRLAPAFPSQQAPPHMFPSYYPSHQLDLQDSDQSVSPRGLSSIAASRRQSSSTYSSVQSNLQQNEFNFNVPGINDNLQHVPRQSSFFPSPQRLGNSAAAFTNRIPLKKRKGNQESNLHCSGTKKPLMTTADTGTYTCTYHGCTLRFETPARLQRHKREGHRNSAAAAAAAALHGGGGMTSAAVQRNSQAGPHKCDRINPSTGKPCNTIFSRPYDLTRHEDTIHNTHKQKVYCPLCEDEKSFSRNDALTRHLRVVHPDYVDPSTRKRRATGE
ncbi:BgTH12-05355 [Blumeria graminis f. sp. triticale]|uniref:Bgt-2435 n=3 Tax=Blumeria graminis TaxID=34373 RepID=A0A061HMN5_BLUGR|nr:hypothetical protein BGT96224_2435 [Blumeria graminis f. sp. tritici 96224]CAD6502765.1 BgTH12-05355 [Blumeria graminis f. sp. triticale]VDB88240.1 Bgt-2435 [Blumeria graminis f. sp. tritici]